VKLQVVLPVALLVIAGCSRLETLTPDLLFQAEGKWKARQPGFYRLVIEMSGDRVETGKFEATVRSGMVISLRRNGLVIVPGQGQEYSMEGLFRMLEQELGLAEKPALLGAPPGYSVYTMAQFDEATGRLIRYRRTVGGTSNEIEVRVIEYEPQG
jgi:hypothetical protein